MSNESLTPEFNEQNPPTFRDALQWVATGESIGFVVLSDKKALSYTILNPGESVEGEPAADETWLPMTNEYAENLLKDLSEDEQGIEEGNELGKFSDTASKNLN